MSYKTLAACGKLFCLKSLYTSRSVIRLEPPRSKLSKKGAATWNGKPLRDEVQWALKRALSLAHLDLCIERRRLSTPSHNCTLSNYSGSQYVRVSEEPLSLAHPSTYQDSDPSQNLNFDKASVAVTQRTFCASWFTGVQDIQRK